MNTIFHFEVLVRANTFYEDAEISGLYDAWQMTPEVVSLSIAITTDTIDGAFLQVVTDLNNLAITINRITVTAVKEFLS